MTDYQPKRATLREIWRIFWQRWRRAPQPSAPPEERPAGIVLGPGESMSVDFRFNLGDPSKSTAVMRGPRGEELPVKVEVRDTVGVRDAFTVEVNGGKKP